jgi:hypothetical protein
MDVGRQQVEEGSEKKEDSSFWTEERRQKFIWEHLGTFPGTREPAPGTCTGNPIWERSREPRERCTGNLREPPQTKNWKLDRKEKEDQN